MAELYAARGREERKGCGPWALPWQRPAGQKLKFVKSEAGDWRVGQRHHGRKIEIEKNHQSIFLLIIPWKILENSESIMMERPQWFSSGLRQKPVSNHT